MLPSTPEEMERAKLTQLGMGQFENLHGPIREQNSETIICNTCDVDWPCERMTQMLVVQSLAMLQSMLPGQQGMAGILQRFSGKQ